MIFEWDDNKNKSNISKHGLDFKDAEEVFASPMMVAFDDRIDYGEDRWIGIGTLRGRTVVVVFVERSNETIRIISLRKALRNERVRYEQYVRDELGKN